MKQLPEKPMMTTAEVAEFFGVWNSTVIDWIAAGEFPGAYKISDKATATYVIPTVEVQAKKERDQSSD